MLVRSQRRRIRHDVMSSLGVATALGVLLAAPGCVDIVASDVSHTERDERQFTAENKPDLNLTTFDGSIEVRSWDRSEVLVVVERRGRDKAEADTIHVDMEQRGNEITVVARRDPGVPQAFGWNKRSASLFITVPRSAAIRARSGDGRILVGDVKGEVSVETGDGSIRIENVDGVVDAQSGDGSIQVDGALSRVRVRSGDGRVTIRAVRGSAAQEDWSVSTGDGSVVLELPDRFDAELDAHTGDGRIKINDIDARGKRRSDRQSVQTRLGAGGHSLRVRTGDGSITLRQL